MSRSIHFVLILLGLVVAATPIAASASQSAPVHRSYGPGGLAPAVVSQRLLPTAATAQPLATAVSGAALAPAEAQPLENWSRISFQSARNGGWDIFSMRSDGSDVRTLTTGPSDDGRPRQNWADGRIVFVSNRSGNWDLFSIAADGSGLRQLTFDAAEDNDPAWSPDGKRIAFASDRSGGNWDVLVMNTDGTGAVHFAPGPEIDWGPAWSPDGQFIAWVRSGGETGRIWVANADGTNAHPISNDLRFLENLAWSPDGSRIAFDYDYGADGWNDVAFLPISGSDPNPTLVHQPSSAFADVLMGSWTPNGWEVFVSEVGYRLEGQALYIENASIVRCNAYRFGPPMVLPGSGIDMSPDWQRADFTPPSSHLITPPDLVQSDKGLTLNWSGSDAGGAGIAAYDLQHRVGDGPWVTTFEGVTKPPVSVGFPSGSIVSFRSRARDAASNVEPWPTSPGGEAQVTFFEARYTGLIFDVRQTPIPGVQIGGVGWPQVSFLSAADGRYDAYSFGTQNSILVADDAYGAVPEIVMWYRQPGPYIALPPKVNAIQNGDFENGFNGWVPGNGDSIGVSQMSHSGHAALRLGQFGVNDPISHTVSQHVIVPAASERPTLSFFFVPLYNSVPIDALSVTVTEQGKQPVALTLRRLDTASWSHAWTDLAEWGGKTVTVTFVATLTGGQYTPGFALDDIAVGEWHTPRITGVDGPMEASAEMTILGENLEPGAAARIDDLPLATTYVDSKTLTAILPGSAKPGSRNLWVQNPGGEEALAVIRIGRPVFMPVIVDGD